MDGVSSGRDEFSEPVKRALAQRTGYLCSNPACRAPTIGPASGHDGAVSVGIAAHVTAAASGGPRYNEALTSAERRSITNGIWCCNKCGRLVDADDSAYEEGLLRSWKLEAEARAARNIAALAAGSSVVKLEKILSGHTSYVCDVAVAPDGRSAVSASNDSTLRVWDLASGVPRHVLTGHETWVCSADISSDGNLVAAGAVDGTVRCWRLNTGEQTVRLPACAEDAKVAWMPDGRLAVGDSSGTVRVWARHGADWKVEHTHRPHNAAVLKVVVLGGNEIATAAADGTAKIWSSVSGGVRLVLEGHSGDVNSVAVDATSSLAVTGAADRSVAIWNLQDGSCGSRLEGHIDTVWRVALSPGSQMIASGSGDNTVRLWDAHSGACLDELAHPDCVAAVAFSPDGSRLIVGCDDDNLYLYEVLGLAVEDPGRSTTTG
jgi:WD40 repeat protein